MVRRLLIALCAAIAVAGLGLDRAGAAVFANDPSFTGGDCRFQNLCSPSPSTYLLTSFSVDPNTKISAFSYVSFYDGPVVLPTEVHFLYVPADASGAPNPLAGGAFSAAGVVKDEVIRIDGDRVWYRHYVDTFTLGLPAGGNWFLGLREMAGTPDDYLAYGLSGRGFLWNDGEVTETGTSYAIRLYGGSVAQIPEPSTWALSIFGFAAIGLVMRRRTREFGGLGIG